MDGVGEGLLGDARRGAAATRSAQAVDPELDPVVERQPGLLAQVLDRALELARVALGPELGRQLGVDDDDQALVVGDGRAGPRRREDLDLVRRRASRRRGVTEPSGVDTRRRPRGRRP